MKKCFSWLLWICCGIWIASTFHIPQKPASLDLQQAGQLPALTGGRLKPLDTVARTSLLSLYGKQTLQISGKVRLTAMEWLMEVMAKPEDADQRQIFRIDHPDTLDLLGFRPEQGKYFSFKSIQPRLDEIERQAALAEPVESGQRSLFQRNILKLFNQLQLYTRLKNTLQVEGSTDLPEEISQFEKSIPAGLKAVQDQQAGRPLDKQALGIILEFTSRYHYLSQTASLMVVPSPDKKKWMNIGEALLQTIKTSHMDPVVRLYADLVAAYRKTDSSKFSRTVDQLNEDLQPLFPREIAKTHFEYQFNLLQPFYKSLVLYVIAFILVLFAWLFSSKFLNRAAFQFALVAFVIHTFGLVARMYIQGRPPVTNLYSSAIFVGWGAVLLGLVLEIIHEEGIGLITSATLGFLTLLVAHNLSLDGDTMEMMRAVLDTNIWLATHVVVVTLGYASTFLAGFLGLVYILRSYFNRLEESIARSLSGMIYGIICFATLFSFVGTVLGGIWADQSWGRFWGWDPKENGALIIVLWNALILHAHWGGMIRQRGLAVMSVFGNIVTSFSWFGVNMLGVGLHSYGFIDKAFLWLAIFVSAQFAVMLLGWFTSLPDPGKKEKA